MEILLTTRLLLRFAGFHQFAHRNSAILISLQEGLIFLICICTVISMAVFAFSATTSNEYLEIFFMGAPTGSILSVHLCLIWRYSKLIKFVDDLETVINIRTKISSQVELIYATANKNVEKLSGYLIKCTMAMSSVFVLHWLLNSVWIISSANHSAGELPLPLPVV